MNRTIKDATIKVFPYPDLESLSDRVFAFVTAYNFAKHLKRLRWRTPSQAICEAWAKDPASLQDQPAPHHPGTAGVDGAHSWHRSALTWSSPDATHEERRPPCRLPLIGLDLAKHVFQVHGVDRDGKIVLRRRLRRTEVVAFISSLPPCLVGMEACSTVHHWARELIALGHEVRLIPPTYVKPYVKRGKNDAADAEAICEAGTRPTMRFVPVKSVEQQSVLVLHQGDDSGLVCERA